MRIYATSATVEAQGQILVAGVPFAPGTEVEVTIRPKVRSTKESAPALAEPAHSDTGMRWEGSVLVHVGVGAEPSIAELRDERLHRLADGSSG